MPADNRTHQNMTLIGECSKPYDNLGKLAGSRKIAPNQSQSLALLGFLEALSLFLSRTSEGPALLNLPTAPFAHIIPCSAVDGCSLQLLLKTSQASGMQRARRL
eukprot:1057727-Pleurochrysis_carterae.AAC.1